MGEGGEYLKEHKDDVPAGEGLSETEYEYKLSTFRSLVKLGLINNVHEVLMDLNMCKEHVRYKLYKYAVNLIIFGRHKEGEC